MRAIAANHSASVAQVALAWVLGHAQISSVLIGASKMSQLEDNLAAANLDLTADEFAQLNKATAPQPDFTVGVSRVADTPIVNALAAKPGDQLNLKANPVV